MPMKFIPSTDKNTIGHYLNWDANEPTKAPFVQIGRVLLAVDQTGKECWVPICEQLMKHKKSNLDQIVYWEDTRQ